MGVVYRARDPAIGRTVAIKVMHAVSAAVRKRFLQEIRILGTLTHQHIVTVHDCGEYDDQPYIVMEFVEGLTLAEYIARTPGRVRDQVVLIRQLCAAIEYAHTHQIVHRDIKPTNLMVDRHGHLKVLDFGIARSGHSLATTSDGHVLGTLNYMSPEQLDGRPVDGRTDIFSIGLVLYELLASRPAFAIETAARVIHSVLHEDPVALATLRPDLDPELSRIVSVALQKDPARRYQAVGSLAADLERVEPRLGLTSLPAISPLPAITPPLPQSQPSKPTTGLSRWAGSLSTSDGRRYVFGIAGVVLLAVSASILLLPLGYRSSAQMPVTEGSPMASAPKETSGTSPPGSVQAERLADASAGRGSSPPPQPRGTPADNSVRAPAPMISASAPPKAWHEVVVPAGQLLTIRLARAISSETSRVAESVDATIANDVLVNNELVIRKGTPVRGTITDAHKGSSPSIGVRFHTLVPRPGVEIDMRIEPVIQRIEAFGGGWRRIITGAATGAAGGAAAAPMTQKPNVSEVAAGSTVTINLLAPITVPVER